MESKNQQINTSSTKEKTFPLYLCLTGIEKHMIDKDLQKVFVKIFGDDDLPLTGIHKKRGTSYAFLKFVDYEQKSKFMENAEEYFSK